jgi:hypothetical protein
LSVQVNVTLNGADVITATVWPRAVAPLTFTTPVLNNLAAGANALAGKPPSAAAFAALVAVSAWIAEGSLPSLPTLICLRDIPISFPHLPSRK